MSSHNTAQTPPPPRPSAPSPSPRSVVAQSPLMEHGSLSSAAPAAPSSPRRDGSATVTHSPPFPSSSRVSSAVAHASPATPMRPAVPPSRSTASESPAAHWQRPSPPTVFVGGGHQGQSLPAQHDHPSLRRSPSTTTLSRPGSRVSHGRGSGSARGTRPRAGTSVEKRLNSLPECRPSAGGGLSASSAPPAPVHVLIHDLYRSVLAERPSQPLPFIVSRLHSAGPSNDHHHLLDDFAMTTTVASPPDSPHRASSTAEKTDLVSPARSPSTMPRSPIPVTVEVAAPGTRIDLGELSPPLSAREQVLPLSEPPASVASTCALSDAPDRRTQASARSLTPLDEGPRVLSAQEVEEVVASPPRTRLNCPTAAPSPRITASTVAHARPSDTSPASPMVLPVAHTSAPVHVVASVSPLPPLELARRPSSPPATPSRSLYPTAPTTRPPLYPQANASTTSAPRSNTVASAPSLTSRGPASPPTTLVIPHGPALNGARFTRPSRGSGCGSDVDGGSVDGIGWCSPGLPSGQVSECSLDFLAVPQPATVSDARVSTSARSVSNRLNSTWASRSAIPLSVSRRQVPSSANSSRLSTPCAATSLMPTFHSASEGNVGTAGLYPSGTPLFALGGFVAGNGGAAPSYMSSGMSHASMTVTAAVGHSIGSTDSSFVSSARASVPAVELAALMHALREAKEETVGHETSRVSFDSICDILENAAVSAMDVQLLAALFDELLRPIFDYPPSPSSANGNHDEQGNDGNTATASCMAPAAGSSPVSSAALASSARSSTVLLSTMPSITHTAIMPGEVVSVNNSAMGDSTRQHAAAMTPPSSSQSSPAQMKYHRTPLQVVPVKAPASRLTVASLADLRLSEISSAASQLDVSEDSDIVVHDTDDSDGDENGAPTVVFDAYVARMMYLISGKYPADILYHTFRSLALLSHVLVEEDVAATTTTTTTEPSSTIRMTLTSRTSGSGGGISTSASPLLPLTLREGRAHYNTHGYLPTAHSPGSSTQSLFVLHRATSLPSTPFNGGLFDQSAPVSAGAPGDLTATVTSTTSAAPAHNVAVPLSLCVVEGLQRQLGIRGLTPAVIAQALTTLGLAASPRHTVAAPAAVPTPPRAAASKPLDPAWWQTPLTLQDFAALAQHLAAVTETLWRADRASHQGSPRLLSRSGSLTGAMGTGGGRVDGSSASERRGLVGADAYGDDPHAETAALTCAAIDSVSGRVGSAVSGAGAADEAGAAAANISHASLTESMGSTKGVVTTVTAVPPGPAPTPRSHGSAGGVEQRTSWR